MIGDRWGVTDAEVARRYPCDDLVHDPSFEVWRGVTVAASPAQLWPWVAQVRLAPYSYDWIDNLGRRSPRELRGLAEPKVGDNFSTAATRRIGRIVAVEPQVHLTAELGGLFLSYVLVPTDAGTRLLLKIAGRTWRGAGTLLSVGDLVMARRQLLNFKAHAERAAGAARMGRRAGG